ncbi:helix-turn-helix domain-containing protein [Bacillus sp. TH13]|uniref:helix-turn-helix domain-containing protein n=1 Tax=Bacillus sp. TH13 TaxID=2796379 RepID=UPI001F5B3A3F|nr:helix-turn-helix domain-containing protein [Bacillus sp. TH13]
MKKEIITHRQFNILMHLDETAGWISSEEIGTYIGCSYKTIQNEIRTIKNLLPENWTLLSKKGYGVRLLHPSDETVANIFVHDSKELIFQLINLLVNKDGYAIEEIGELLYINRNTTVQLLKQVRHIIKPFF